jgi:hypothetical protein
MFTGMNSSTRSPARAVQDGSEKDNTKSPDIAPNMPPLDYKSASPTPKASIDLQTTPLRYFDLLALSPELRLCVYDHVFTGALESKEDRWTDRILAFMCTRKQVHAEAKKHFTTRITQNREEVTKETEEVEGLSRTQLDSISARCEELAKSFDEHALDEGAFEEMQEGMRRARKEADVIIEKFTKQYDNFNARIERLQTLYNMLHGNLSTKRGYDGQGSVQQV